VINDNIQFTMEIEAEGHLSFLDVNIYKKMDGSLGHQVYWKPTHTNFYLHQKTHQLPANKHSVLSSRVHRAKALCDQKSLAPELTLLNNVFKQNCYCHQQIKQALNPVTRINKTEENPYRQPTYHTHKPRMVNPAECWRNVISKVPPNHLRKYRATCHKPKMHQD